MTQPDHPITMLDAFNRANPGLNPGFGADARACDAKRVVAAGGMLADLLLHPSVIPFQQIFRKLPLDGIAYASRTQPFTFEIGAFNVPINQALAVAEYQFDIFRFSGAVAEDAVPIESRRLPISVGYDLNFDQFRKGQIQAEIIPQPPPVNPTAFRGNVTGGSVGTGSSISPDSLVPGGVTGAAAVPSAYSVIPGGTEAAAKKLSAIGTSGAGNALLPQNQLSQQGPQKYPFTFYANQSTSVQLKVSVFGRVNIPIAFFEARLAGYLMPQNTLLNMLEALQPCTIGRGK